MMPSGTGGELEPSSPVQRYFGRGELSVVKNYLFCFYLILRIAPIFFFFFFWGGGECGRWRRRTFRGIPKTKIRPVGKIRVPVYHYDYPPFPIWGGGGGGKWGGGISILVYRKYFVKDFLCRKFFQHFAKGKEGAYV